MNITSQNCISARQKALFSAGSFILLQSMAIAASRDTPISAACPLSVQEKSVHLVDIPSGWTPFVSSPLYLHGAAPMDGPPERLGELADFTQKGTKNQWTYTYQLKGKFPDGKWLACTYGESDQITLSKRLDDNVHACTFTYRRGKYVGQNDIAIDCK